MGVTDELANNHKNYARSFKKDDQPNPLPKCCGPGLHGRQVHVHTVVGVAPFGQVSSTA